MTAFSHIRSAALTDVGRKRKNNEDSFGSFPSVGIFCVADGMGGGDDGEIASAATIQSVERIVAALTPPDGFAFAGDRVADAVSAAVNAASNWIYRRAQARRLGSCGSTFVGICFDAATPSSALALHAGDSRLYRVRKGEIQQLTSDHSAANMMGAKTEAEAIRMKALAEAEGLEKKAEAMAKYGEAAKMDLQLQVAKVYCEQLPEIAKGISEAYAKVGNITMYGDQSAAIASGVIDKTAQLSDGLAKGIGIDLKSLLAGVLGAKILEKNKE